MIPLRVDKGYYHMGCSDLQDMPTFWDSWFETSFNCQNVTHKHKIVWKVCVFLIKLLNLSRIYSWWLGASFSVCRLLKKHASKSSALLINPSVFNSTLSVFVSPFTTRPSDSVSCNLLSRHGRETATQRVCNLLPSSKEPKWRDIALLSQLSDL